MAFLKKLHILLVEKHSEDAVFFQKLLTASSTASDFSFKTFSSLEEALKHPSVEANPVFVLATGAYAGDLSEAADKISAQMPSAAMVFLADLDDEARVNECRHPGVQDTILKTRMDEFSLKKIIFNAFRLKKSQDACSEIKDFMGRTLNSLTEGVFILSGDQRILESNASACDLLDRSSDEMEGRPVFEVLLGSHLEDRSAVQALSFIQKSVEDGTRRVAERVSFFNRANQPVSVHAVAEPVIHEGKKKGIAVIFRSITGALRTEEKLKDAIQEQLRNEQRLVEALSELKKLNQQLKETQDQLIQAEKLQSVGRLAAGVAHEVKNPLAILLQGVEYLQQILPKEDGDVGQVLEDIRDAVRRADAVIKGLLDFASPVEPEMREESLPEIIEESLLLVKHLLVKNRIQVTKNFDPDLKKVVLDRNRMQQVFVNLISNAIYAMSEDGELVLSVRLDTNSKWHAIVEIKDTGSGISPEILDKIFDPFVTTRRGKGGTGLGLSVVRGIIEMHRGEIRIENRADVCGTKVTVCL